jgi:hypothetical protein
MLRFFLFLFSMVDPAGLEPVGVFFILRYGADFIGDD